MKTLVLGGHQGPADALERVLRDLGSPPQMLALEADADCAAELVLICDEGGDGALRVLQRFTPEVARRPALVVVTSSAAPARAEAFIDAGASDVLRWPDEEAFLRPRLKAVLTCVRSSASYLHQEEAQAKFDLLFHNELDAISLTDLGTGTFIDVNEAWVKLYGYTRAEAVGRMGPKDVSAEASATQAAIFRSAEGGPACKHVRWHKSREGMVFPVEIYAGSYSYRGRKVLVAMIRDITDRVKLESQLAQADRMASVGTLAAGVAHEINNPLSFVLGNLEYLSNAVERHLRGEPVDPLALREAVAEAQDGSRRVREIVRDLKTFSRADEVQPEPVELSAVMDVALRLLSNEIRHRAVLRRRYESVPRALVNGGRLGQVFVNLITNAVQSLPEVPPEDNLIEVVVREGGAGEVIGEVRDSGHGIPPEHLERIFDPFFTTKPVGDGMGLGLAICHSIVAGFGGRLEVESTVGKGSVFRVVLPIAPAAVDPAHGAGPPPLAGAAVARRLRLLLIDDERNLGLVLGRALEPELELDFVTDARDGLKKIAQGERFDAVVCDLMMPALSGMEFYEELRRVDAALAERTGFITGGTFTPPAREFASRMRGRIIEKPFMAEDLHSFVRTLVGNAGISG